MKNENISQETIRNYLIGALDEATTEALDELSVTSQEFADQVEAEQYDLVDDWVAGRLDATERASFGTVLARSPALREKVRISHLWTAAPKGAVVERPAERVGFFADLFGGLPRLTYSLAGIAVLIGLSTLFVYLFRGSSASEIAKVEPPIAAPSNNPALPTPTAPEVLADERPTPNPVNEYQPDNSNARKPTPEPARSAARPFVVLTLSPPTRGNGEIKSVKIVSGVEYLDLTVQTEAEPDGRFRVEIGDASSGKIDWTSVPVAVNAKNGRASIKVRVPAAKLRSGLRSIRLRKADAENEIVDEHFLKIVH